MTPRYLIATLTVLWLALAGSAPAAAQCGDRQVACGGDIVVLGCDPEGAVVFYEQPTAFDDCGPLATYLLSGLHSGSVFPFGTTRVEWRTDLDANGSYVSCSFDVTVEIGQRRVYCPDDIVVVGCDADGAVVTYDQPTASGDCGTLPTYILAGLSSGSVFPYGTTRVEWRTDLDVNGSYVSCSFNVTVEISPRRIECPDDIVVTGCGPDGAVVNYDQPTAFNSCGPLPTFLLSGAASGAVFPYGSTRVEWRTDLDANGSYMGCSFNVTVLEDATPPAILCPEPVTVFAADGEPSAVVNHEIEVDDECPGGVTFEFDPPNGSALSCGTTPVTVTARDMAGNESSCTFDVTVGLSVPVDVKPGVCPNRYSLESSGNVAVAILGWSGFDPSRVDPTSVRLEGVAPEKWSFRDVGAPYLPSSGKDDCGDCAPLRKDRITDLDFTFRGADLRDALDGALPGECRVLRLTGMTVDGCPISGEDVVEILPTGRLETPGNPPNASDLVTVLHAAHPNPVASATEIRWEMAAPARASLAIYDVAGRRVRTLADGWRDAGSHAATWDGRDDLGASVPNGVYLSVLNLADGATPRLVRKMIVSR